MWPGDVLLGSSFVYFILLSLTAILGKNTREMRHGRMFWLFSTHSFVCAVLNMQSSLSEAGILYTNSIHRQIRLPGTGNLQEPEKKIRLHYTT